MRHSCFKSIENNYSHQSPYCYNSLQSSLPVSITTCSYLSLFVSLLNLRDHILLCSKSTSIKDKDNHALQDSSSGPLLPTPLLLPSWLNRTQPHWPNHSSDTPPIFLSGACAFAIRLPRTIFLQLHLLFSIEALLSQPVENTYPSLSLPLLCSNLHNT